MIKFIGKSNGLVECTLDLASLYTTSEIVKFNERWIEFFASDPANKYVLKRNGNIITHPHKSWIPIKRNNKPSVLMLFGNPAPHSVYDDIYFSHEGDGREHRFWKIMRELEYLTIDTNPYTCKEKFFNLEYESPFRIGLEVLYTFPSTPSKPKWSGVAGIHRLFGKRVMGIMNEIEKVRIQNITQDFIKKNGAVICFQKDAYNAIASNSYNVHKAVDFNLISKFGDIPVYGTPPTRWLYTKKMKKLLLQIKEDILNTQQ